ncbi:gamma-D-glutamyl-L-lysine endopeptidase [Priestia megaterium]|uniref:Gamma-D-glutamyl-L-lysine endopeptidase n=1 Tax=Priestia megaterium (strain ATCC 14581 / DSM 32 / CCUG 1817 / JCM 2506 / NBRC 15308 / NCIMB 9376 / NCTC 10342 / NRRL B-14308 / VKM B-512 / Ford 19) TaxID=1348623 RepID=A0A0B6AKY9_PRIM2|nr:gamma-D-glutamyl-L-lysine endopeptidase [Priestia megaterium NBRC 15308 = ATCC 14581]KFM95989.1 gamma-D-glutamyl-L-lysine endopeptidase [Priestia megaterium]SUV20641.1 cell wall endopeptidase [Priestia megaterium]
MIDKKTYYVCVAVATVWTSYDSCREIDDNATSVPVKLDKWLEQLTYTRRLELCEKNLVQTQLLLGEEVYVTERKGKWAKIVIPSQFSSKDERGYPGWVPSHQLISQAEYSPLNKPTAVVTAAIATLQLAEEALQISYQTQLPLLKEDKEWLEVQTPVGSGKIKRQDAVVIEDRNRKATKGTGDVIIAAGEQFLNLPYLWGGMSAWGYDCSGFAYATHKANGYLIPRDATDQARRGKEVGLDSIQPGDLLFFAHEKGEGSIHHVGIYYGKGKMLHSPKTGKTVELIELKGTLYEEELCAARRYY